MLEVVSSSCFGLFPLYRYFTLSYVTLASTASMYPTNTSVWTSPLHREKAYEFCNAKDKERRQFVYHCNWQFNLSSVANVQNRRSGNETESSIQGVT